MKVSEKKELSQIELWKEEYGKIYKSVIGDDEYIWRRIKRSEYSNVMSLSIGETADERIYNRQVAISKAVVLNYSEEILDIKFEELAGLPTVISEEVLEKSGFNLTSTTEL